MFMLSARKPLLLLATMAIGLFGAVEVVAAAPATQPAATDRANLAMQLLRDNCIACHNPEKHKGGLILTSRASALKGNDNGPAFVPGKSAESRLIEALSPDADPHMPPKKQLPAEQIAAL